MSATITEMEFFGRLMSPETLRNPYPYFDELREAGPLALEADVPTAVFTRHASVFAILQDKRFSTDWATSYRFARELDAEEQPIFERLVQFFRLWMQSNDGPKHQRIRGLVHRAFTPKMLETMQGTMRTVVDKLVVDMAATMKRDGRVDFLATFARLLPEAVIADMFGIPYENRSEFTRVAKAVFGFMGVRDPAPGALAEVERDLTAVRNFLVPLIEKRRERPGTDLISAFVCPDEKGDVLSVDEIIVQCSMMLAAGHDTTANLLGNGMLALLRNPAQIRKLKEDPAVLKTAVEECLRFESPALWTMRLAGEDFEYEGISLKKGQMVWLGIGAANRDGQHFENPEVFDVVRTPGKSMSLGWGAHYCLGAALTRMEAQIAFERIFATFDKLELATEDLTWEPNFMLRALTALPVRNRRVARRVESAPTLP